MDYFFATDKDGARLSHAILAVQGSTEQPALCGYTPEPGHVWNWRGLRAEYGNCARCMRLAKGRAAVDLTRERP